MVWRINRRKSRRYVMYSEKLKSFLDKIANETGEEVIKFQKEVKSCGGGCAGCCHGQCIVHP